MIGMEIPAATQEVVDAHFTPQIQEAIGAYASFSALERHFEDVNNGLRELGRLSECVSWLSPVELDSLVASLLSGETQENEQVHSSNGIASETGMHMEDASTVVLAPTVFMTIYDQFYEMRGVIPEKSYQDKSAIMQLIQMQVFGQAHDYWPNSGDDRSKVLLHAAFSMALEDVGSVLKPSKQGSLEELTLRRFSSSACRVLAGLQTLDTALRNSTPTLFANRRDNEVAAVYLNAPNRQIQVPHRLGHRDDSIPVKTRKTPGMGGFDVKNLQQADCTQPRPLYSDVRKRMNISLPSLLSPVVVVPLPELLEEGWWHLPQLDGTESNPMTPRIVIVDGLTNELAQEHVPEHAQTYRQVYSTLGLFARTALLA